MIPNVKTLLSINNYFYRRGGAEVVFLEHNRLFEDAGWRVVPFAMRHENNLPTEWNTFFPEEIEYGRDYTLIEKAKNAFKITHSFESAEKGAALVDHIAPSVAHAHNVYHHLSPSIFRVLKNRGVPVVLTLHDLKIACPAIRMLARDGICERCKGGAIWNVVSHRCIKNSLALSTVIFMETAVQRFIGSYSRYVDRFVVPSRFYIEKFVEWGWDRARFVYIPNFVDVSALQPAGVPGESFAYVGRLGPEKGVGTFIRALAQSGCTGVIVGTGPEEGRLKALAARLGASVQFLGYRTGEDLFDTIRAARAIVLPSEWYENAPMSVMEAYALERPVIGACIGGIPELIREGETGVTFESGNSEALAGLLADFNSRPVSELQAMGRTGRQWVEREYSDLRYRDRILELYETMGVVQ
ncbi:MAG: glycosyltransferase family 4 protein [Methylococcales bacterium]